MVTRSDLLPVNFTLSLAAKRAIEALKTDHDQRFPGDPAAVPAIGWGYVAGTHPFSGGVTVGFYRLSESERVTDGIQEVSGLKFVYFTTETFHPLFEDKVLDHADGRGFFLRSQ